MLLRLKNLEKKFNQKPSPDKKALDCVNFCLKRSEIVGLVGESGCGKTTIANCLTGLINFDGDLIFSGEPLSSLSNKQRNIMLREKVQMIFQDASSSLHPLKTVKKNFDESRKAITKITSKKISDNYNKILSLVGFNENNEILKKKPRNFSGGEIQRISIARALIAEPEILVADEPVSNLDVVKQSEILNLLKHLNKTNGLSILFISHDIAVTQCLADWIIVMKEGKIIEQNTSYNIIHDPQENYTKELVDAAKLDRTNRS